ncbi:hypothetical protein BO83DRAFT_92376 [Aspergillus eucalypticola CBS 122712]|uniref:Uncharacterized protein n=1 Tax=Aspergillus eucalypticola (strain CBS 122712 / IBT 29274) TaxID=1448314 RepID=A0A317V687_ASPEC|nr:uncharacterized protein BO83DRAFT_92376 [Aspergillus eucalypticola CBS 122712]PWY67660.1 hypothetical protein BO83DRAFT_92376 [Aspergillus eucalypticola CBS 122712]
MRRRVRIKQILLHQSLNILGTGLFFFVVFRERESGREGWSGNMACAYYVRSIINPSLIPTYSFFIDNQSYTTYIELNISL